MNDIAVTEGFDIMRVGRGSAASPSAPAVRAGDVDEPDLVGPFRRHRLADQNQLHRDLMGDPGGDRGDEAAGESDLRLRVAQPRSLGRDREIANLEQHHPAPDAQPV